MLYDRQYCLPVCMREGFRPRPPHGEWRASESLSELPMTYGFGIIGCGAIAPFHARAIADTPGAVLKACYNRTPESAQRLSEQFNCRVYSDLHRMLNDPEIHIVTIATASGAHLEPGIAAAQAGKHVLVEKPLEITLERCDALINACASHGVHLGTIFPSRCHDASLALKNAVDSGRFGKLVLGDAYVKWFRTQQYYDSGAWRGTWQLDGGGALMNQAIHSVDLLNWIMGPIVEVRARTALRAHERIEVEDTVVATVQFASGALGVIEATTAAYPGYLKKLEIHGSTGSATLEEESLTRWDFAEKLDRDDEIRKRLGAATTTGGGAADPKAIGHKGHACVFADFLKAVEQNERPPIDGAEGRKSVEVILAIYQSAQSNQAVALPLKPSPKIMRPGDANS